MQVRTENGVGFAKELRQAGYKATSGRLALLDALNRSKKPLTVVEAVKAMRPKLDLVNAYRALESFAKTGLVRKVDLHHQHAHYEIGNPAIHHHHIVCEICGKVEDIRLPETGLEKRALEISGFGVIRSHALEFFGECSDCAKNT